MPYGITQCYLPPGRGDKLVLDLATPDDGMMGKMSEYVHFLTRFQPLMPLAWLRSASWEISSGNKRQQQLCRLDVPGGLK